MAQIMTKHGVHSSLSEPRLYDLLSSGTGYGTYAQNRLRRKLNDGTLRSPQENKHGERKKNDSTTEYTQ